MGWWELTKYQRFEFAATFACASSLGTSKARSAFHSAGGQDKLFVAKVLPGTQWYKCTEFCTYFDSRPSTASIAGLRCACSQ